ncbi:MAG: 30S ribosomal protein S6 [Patescibacteria group bacterium]
MREYELTYLISDNVPESDLNKVTGKVGGYVTSLNGKILKEEIWGRRKLAYPIKKQDFATYVTLNFSLPAEKANEFEHNIFMSSKIIRHLMIVQDYGSEELTLTKEDVAETEEITKVIGGEKSFEAVIGETEESKDLMAVRGDEVETEEPKKETKKEKTPEKTELEEEVEDAASTEGGAGAPASTESGMRGEPKKAAKTTKKAETPKKPAKTAKKAEKKPEDEADRLSKLDKELDDILGDDL